MKKILTLLLGLTCALQIVAQRPFFNDYQQSLAIYKINALEAKQILEGTRNFGDTTLWYQLVKTWPVAKRGTEMDDLVPGHYLQVWMEQEYLNGQYIQKPLHHLGWIEGKDNLLIQVLDEKGYPSTPKLIELNGVKAKYDSKAKIYVLPIQKKFYNELMTVCVGSDTIYQKVGSDRAERGNDYRYRRRFRFSYLWRYPMIWTMRGWNMIARPFTPKHSGYVLLNQHKFKHNDTLQASANIRKRNGKPYQGEVVMAIYGMGKELYKDTLRTDKNGFVSLKRGLGDSLKLDAYYYLQTVALKGGQRRFNTSSNFYLEDYELDRVEYTATLKHEPAEKLFHAGDSVQIEVAGKDRNGLYVPDGSVRVILLPQQYSIQAFTDSCMVLDTVWQQTLPMLENGPTLITIPNDKLPKALLTYDVRIEIVDSRGELHLKNLSFRYENNPVCIVTTVENGLMKSSFRVNGQEKVQSVKLQRYMNGKLLKTENLSLPFEEQLDYFYTSFKFSTTYNGQEVSSDYTINSYTVSQGINTVAEIVGDSILLSLTNPNALPLAVALMYDNKAVKWFKTNDNAAWAWPYESKKAPVVRVYRSFGDQLIEVQQVSVAPKQTELYQLNITQPSKIEPGATADIVFSVTDKNNKPVKGVNLSATSLNAGFDVNFSQLMQLYLLKNPLLTERLRKNKRARFELYFPSTYKVGLGASLKLGHIHALRTDSLLYYRMLLTDSVFMYLDSNATDANDVHQLQLAPFVIEKGQYVPVQMVYVNSRLAYLKQANPSYAKYSFGLQKGSKNYITLRTHDAEYRITLDTILSPGKLFLAINGEQPGTKVQKIAKLKAEWSWQERSLIETQFMVLDYSNNAYLSQGQRGVHKLAGRTLVGPFDNGSQLQLNAYGNFKNNFLFEPGFRYVVSQNRERLYKEDIVPRMDRNKIRLNLNDLILDEQDIPAWPVVKKDTVGKFTGYYGFTKSIAIKSNVYLKIEHQKAETPLLALLVLGPDNEIMHALWSNNQETQLLDFACPAGKYQFFLVDTAFQIYRYDAATLNDARLYITINIQKGLKLNPNKAAQLLEYWGQHTWNGRTITRKPLLVEPMDLGFQPNEIRGNQAIRGQVVDKETGEGIPFANIVVQQKGKGQVTGTTTDFDGFYQVGITSSGAYDLVVSYIGYPSRTISNIIVLENQSLKVDVVLEGGLSVEEIQVVSYSVPLIKTSDVHFTAADLERRGKLDLKQVAASAPRVAQKDEGIAINANGIRSESNEVYVDGIRTKGAVMDSIMTFETENAPVNLRSVFRDNAFFIPSLVTDRKGQAKVTVQFPEDITSWETYAVGTTNKRYLVYSSNSTQAYKAVMAELAVPRFLVAGDSVNIVGLARNLSKDSLQVRTSFNINGVERQSRNSRLSSFFSERLNISAQENDTLITVQYSLQSIQSDGEEREIKVFPQGMEYSTGTFRFIDQDTSFSFNPNPELGPINLRVEADMNGILNADLSYLKQYPYGCNEQTASRLMALLLDQQINQHKDNEKAIAAMIQRLEKAQKPDGSWGWWATSDYNPWMTVYVSSVLHKAQKMGYPSKKLELAKRFLVNYMPNFNTDERIYTTLNLLEMGLPVDSLWLKEINPKTSLTDYQRISLLRIEQLQGKPLQVDSLLKLARMDIFGNVNFDRYSYHWYNNGVNNSLLVFDALFDANRNDLCAKMVYYWLRNRSAAGYRNTLETARILEAIIVKWNKGEKPAPASISINGQQITKFPYQATLSGKAPLQVKADIDMPMYFSATQRAFNPAPKADLDTFNISTKLMQEGKEVRTLTFGKPAQMVVTLQSYADAEYMMLNIPVPASCSYGDKNWVGSYVSHTEYFRERVSIFCERLPKGTHTFTINLEPRFTGTFNLNPATAEMMYFPTFRGNNELRVVRTTSVD